MSETLTPDMIEANEFVACLKETQNYNGRKYSSNGSALKEKWKDGDYLRKLERRLAKERKPDLARQVRLRRNQMDKESAEAILSSGAATPDVMLKLAKRLAENKLFGLARRILKLKCEKLSQSEHRDIFTEFWQKHALYTYKDPDLPLEWRLDEALRILGKPDDLTTTKNRETLGLAGAIHKRKWEVDGRRAHLGHALAFYLRGYAMGLHEEHVAADAGKAKRAAPVGKQSTLDAARAEVLNYLRDNPKCVLQAGKQILPSGFEREGDNGYNGINAAFILDILARLEEDEMGSAGADSAEYRRESARLIREEIIRSVPPLAQEKGGEWLADEWWFYATVGEAYFGLGQYKQAVEWMRTRPEAAGLTIRLGAEPPSGLEVPEWEYETTARQLARLARLRYDSAITEEEFKQTPAGAALNEILRGNEKAVGSAFRGKFGLGLSGGGFRASLFHIGVLARLAELDVLRHVEVLSCVSGGSIIGAHYYLEVRRLLQTKADDEITREDYIEIVQRVERDFLAGVQRNIRTRVAAEWVTNMRMIFSSGYTRTLRVGELYERELFSRVPDGEGLVTGPKWVPDWVARLIGWKREPRWLNKVKIYPKLKDGGLQDDFKPRGHNWRRDNKAPDLILNAAALNTGHNWQFTASFMGEPPAPINKEIDCNYRLRRMYYDDAPKKYRDFRLGHAVAASSCVPGLFDPIILDDLYPDGGDKLKDEYLISVRLVDGGVCDNQGIASLLEQDCTVLLISDASGQMEATNVPGGGPLGVLLRTTSVVQARVREAQYTDINTRQRSSLLRGLMFIHLRQDLPGGSVTWRDCPSSLKESEFESKQDRSSDLTGYDIAADVQRKLAAIRTDLDSFTDAEAFALMASGYRMTKRKFEDRCVEGFPSPPQQAEWRFLSEKMEKAMKPRSVGDEKGREHLEKMLDAGSNIAFKIWKLSPVLKVFKWVLAAAVVAAVAWLFYDLWNASIIPPAISSSLTFKNIAWTFFWMAVITLVTFILNVTVGKKSAKTIMRLVRWRSTVKNILLGLGMSTLGFMAARLHLHVFDKFFLRYGKLDKFPK